MPELRCIVQLYKKYLEKCPKSALEKKMFYLTPRRKCSDGDKEWFTANPIGHNPLGETVRKLCKEAGIKGYFTTTATRGLEKHVPEKHRHKNSYF
ncbi:hypothetical protein QZH41_016949 [Actinostola sp. cb2023]|nr:hypothetical protein QZH41_016949 [Actinostola sp. cb2023]